MLQDYVFTSESVSEGHPDKVCDQISDAIVDFFLYHDPQARVATEVLATTNRVVIAGETRAVLPISIKIDTEIDKLVRSVVRNIGYEQQGFHWNHLEITNLLHDQSPEIAQGIDATNERSEGAGDQGIMFGYACDETPDFMPAPISYAHQILKRLSYIRKSGDTRLLPDAKSQFSLIYQGNIPVGVDSIVVSSQHANGVSQSELTRLIRYHIREILPSSWSMPDKILINPTGSFTIGGPDGDTGLTGRKIIVDTYGGTAPHGGGAFSGKDPTKMDRSGAYIARYMAKNIVASELAKRCTIQICYAIGIVKPLGLYVSTHNTAKISDRYIEEWLINNIDLSPRGIIKKLRLDRPIYQPTSSYGHFGRIVDESNSFSWEATDLIDALQKLQ